MKTLLRSVPLLFLLSASLLPAQKTPPDPLAPTHNVKSAAEIDQEWQKSVSKYDTQRNTLLKEADRQANDGPFRPDWESLRHYE